MSVQCRVPGAGLQRGAACVLAVLFTAAGLRAEPPALIPRDLLFGNPARTNPQLSPDGTRLAFLAPSEAGVQNVWVQPLAGGEPVMATQDRGRGIDNFQWAHDGVHLLYIGDQDGDENWHVYAFNLETGAARDLTPYDGVAANDILTDPNHPNVVLVSLNKTDRTRFDMYRVRIDTGEVTLEVEDPGDVQNWATDHEFRVRGASALDKKTADTILRVRDLESGAWRDVVRWPFDQVGSVLYRKIVAFNVDGSAMCVQSPMGGDKTRIVMLDTHTGKELETIAAGDSSDISNIWWNPQLLLHPKTHAVQAVAFDYLVPEWRVLDPALEADFASLRRLAGDGAIEIAGRDHADRLWVVRIYSDIDPGVHYVYDRTTKKETLLFESRPELKKHTLARYRSVTYTARDGMRIPAYLTLPPGVPEKNLPLIVHPHGGPWARTYWDFDPFVQLLANRGYAVLQPNFRGSTGYGKAFINASNAQWSGTMQDDLTDGVKWAIAQGLADPKRIAIIGGSYGGYAALCGVTFTPELYACAVDIVGPSNVATLFASFPPQWEVRRLRWKKRLGPVDTDEAFNRKISPLFHADKIRAPLLIAHGANDPRVKLSESEAIVAAARKNKVDVTFVVYPDEGHGFGRPENNNDFTGRVEEFLAKHLGGRMEPWRAIEGTSADVR